MKSFILFVGIFAFAFTAHAQEQARSILAAQLSEPSVLASKHSMEKLVTTAENIHAKTIFIQVYRANHAWFISAVGDQMKYQECLRSAGVDPLKFLIERAHARNIKVYAWLNLLSLANNPKAKILEKYGSSILTRNRAVKKDIYDYKIDNQYFLEPSSGAVRQELTQLLKDLIGGYSGIDGVLFDYIRYPDVHPDYGYAPENIAKFHERFPNTSLGRDSEKWEEWKRTAVTGLLASLANKARELKPGIAVASTACAPFLRAYSEAYQDWPSWIKNDLVDFVLVMSYPDNVAQFDKYLKEAQAKAGDVNKLYIGLPAYKLTKNPQIFIEQLKSVQASKAGGYSIFHYDSLLEMPLARRSLIDKQE